MKFTAIAFDLDGTLYPNSRLYIRLVPFVLKEHRLLRAMGKARTLLRKEHLPEDSLQNGDFYDIQASLMGQILGQPADEVKKRTEKLIYRGWEPHFLKVRLFPHVKETLKAFRKAGLKLGLLSDFPPETKLKNLDIHEYWDAVLGSEQSGHIKPHSAPFLELSKRLETAPKDILYVGNSISYDVNGASKAGMKTALIHSKWKKRPKIDLSCFVFHDYRQLYDYVLS